MSKYRSRKATADGITFDSKRERDRYLELKLLEKAGVITDLVLQPRYVIHNAYVRCDGKKVREIQYIPDFRYFDTEKNAEVIEDVKGVKTEVYRIKKKLFEKRYGVKITEV